MSFRDELVNRAILEFDVMGGAKEPGASSTQSAAKTAKARELIKKGADIDSKKRLFSSDGYDTSTQQAAGKYSD